MILNDSNDEQARRQAQARARLRAQTAQLREQAQTNQYPFDRRPTTKDLMDDESEGDTQSEDTSDGVQNAHSRDRSLDPEGPPWHYDLTSAEREKRKEKRQRQSKRQNERRQKLEGKSSGKTSDKPNGPAGLGVRIRTGAIYIIVTTACILLGDIPTVIMLMAVAGICAGEFYFMLRSDAKLPNEVLGIIAAVLYPPSVYFYGAAGVVIVTIVFVVALLVWYVFWLRSRIPDVAISFFGATYTGLLLCGIVIVRMSVDGIWGGVLVFLLFAGVWINDAFAYLIGSRFGKHKLAPRTSPKKSWEGLIAGLVGSVIFWILMAFVPGVNMPIYLAIIFGIICGVMEVLGDLVESRIKRNSGVKDSGTIMPGHGGLLDRSDSLLFASFTAAFLLVVGGCIPYVA